jgi:RNA polymerase sigma-70 factor (ECF subfamily)
VAELDLAGIYANHRQGLFTHALLITRSAERAEDAVHDAIANLCGRDAVNIVDPVAYVFAAVRTSAINQTRSAQRSQPTDSLFAGSDAQIAAPDAQAIQTERTESVIAAVNELPADHREVVVLRVYAGLTFAQIAAIMCEPLPTIASRYRRSLERLKQQLEKLV